MTDAYIRAKAFSEGKLQELRAGLSDIVPPEAVAITVGSYARREASEESDIDFFIAAGADADADSPWVAEAKGAIAAVVSKGPSAGGAFDEVISLDSLVSKIGGNEDSNKNITRRMLFLLEGEWLSNEAGFGEMRSGILNRYISDSMHDHQVALFLLNDIIRYWRTITVDYEHKTGDQSSPKPWAIRNLKLAFSRKLLYAGGLFSIGVTADRTPVAKRQKLNDLFSIPALDRIEEICGSERSRFIRESYDIFLSAIEDNTVRSVLDGLDRSQQHDDSTFRDLKNESYRFTRLLMSAFEQTFQDTHPIRKAVIF